MVIERSASNTLVVMARETLSPSYWLLHFNDPDRNGNAYCIVQAGNATGAMITLTFTEVASGAVATSGQVTLSPPGNWQVTIYEQTSSSNLNTASANRLVYTQAIFVEGGAGAETGWTDECPSTGDECDPLTVEVNGTTYGTLADPCGATFDVDVVDEDDVAVGSLTGGGKWEIPDADVTFDGLPVGDVAPGQTLNLDCGTLLDGAYVSDGGSVTGNYFVTGMLNGREVYTKDVDHNLEYTGTRWRLVKPGSDVDAALGSEEFPWNADWSATSVTVEQATIGSYCGGDQVPCADLTIAINGTTYGTVTDPCGATAAVNVHDSNGNDVGSLVSGAWVVEPPANVLREYTTGGTWNKPTSPSFKGVWVFAAGAGGAGGAGGFGANSAAQPTGGAGAGGGSLVRLWIPAASLGLTETYAIGSGAVSVATGNGGAGGATLFGAHVEAKGGSGGTGGSNGSIPLIAGASGGSALLNVPIASGASISGGGGGSSQRSAGSPGVVGLVSAAAAGGGGGGGISVGTTTTNGGAGGGMYQAGTLTAGGAGGTASGGNGTAGVSDIYLDPFVGLIASTIGLGTGGGGGASNLTNTTAGSGGAGGRACGGGGGGGIQGGGGGTRGASGAGGNGFLLVYEVYAI